ncbi:MAG: response regulator transcription factor [Chloroflexi bacterium]|nr:response regulator transcription factor [Chloroflexota bacterium]
MKADLILVIERAPHAFAPALEEKGFTVEVVSSGRSAIERAAQDDPPIVILNAASLGSSGVRIAKKLREDREEITLIYILPEGADASKLKKETQAHVILVMPFTARKLINRILRYLPGQRDDAIEMGPIRLSPRARIVEAYGREKRLTPKTAQLLEVFMQHPQETLERAFLMQEVWKTDYVGDTRTLDVHVRWVREAVEPIPGKPCHVMTVRGKGYRFTPEPPEHIIKQLYPDGQAASIELQDLINKKPG